MATIRSIDARAYRVPLPVVLSDSTHGEMSDFLLNLVEVVDEDLQRGVGYTYSVARNGSAIHAILTDEMPAIVVGEDADRIEWLWQRVWWALHYGGRGGPSVLAQSALDMALWDLKGVRAGQPLWRLLGGYDPAVPCYAGGIDLDFTIDALLEQADRNRERGFRALKMKVGRPRLSEDVERVARVREHLGADFPLMVDANMRWSADQAIAAARRLQPYGLTWIEEPIVPDDLAAHARVLREGGVAIATGENLRTPWEFRHLIASGGVSFPEPDVTNCGGVTAFMKIARLAETFNLPVTSHGAHDVSVQLLAACPNRSYLEVHGFGLDPYLREPLRIADGCAIARDEPGHGVRFDLDALERFSCA